MEKANNLICNGINKRLLAPLERAKGAWVDELPSVLWSLRTTPNVATQERPFFLVHGAEAVLPVEITHEAPRVTEYEEVVSTKALEDNVDALDEARDVALARSHVSIEHAQLPHPSTSSQVLQCGGFGPSSQARWPPQAGVAMGGTLHRHGGDSWRSLSPPRQEDWSRSRQPMARRAVASILRLIFSIRYSLSIRPTARLLSQTTNSLHISAYGQVLEAKTCTFVFAINKS